MAVVSRCVLFFAVAAIAVVEVTTAIPTRSDMFCVVSIPQQQRSPTSDRGGDPNAHPQLSSTTAIPSTNVDARCLEGGGGGGYDSSMPRSVDTLAKALSKESGCTVVELCPNAVYEIGETIVVNKAVDIQPLDVKDKTSTRPVVRLVASAPPPLFRILIPALASDHDINESATTVSIRGITIDVSSVKEQTTGKTPVTFSPKGIAVDVVCPPLSASESTATPCAQDALTVVVDGVTITAEVSPNTHQFTGSTSPGDKILAPFAEPHSLVRWEGPAAGVSTVPSGGSSDPAPKRSIDTPRLHVLNVAASISATLPIACDLSLGGECIVSSLAVVSICGTSAVLLQSVGVTLLPCTSSPYLPRITALWLKNTTDVETRNLLLNGAALVHVVAPASRLYFFNTVVTHLPVPTTGARGPVITLASVPRSTDPQKKTEKKLTPTEENALSSIHNVFVQSIVVADVPGASSVLFSTAHNVSCMRVDGADLRFEDFSSTAFIFDKGFLDDVLITNSTVVIPCGEDDEAVGDGDAMRQAAPQLLRGPEGDDTQQWPPCQMVKPPSNSGDTRDVVGRVIALGKIQREMVRVQPWHASKDFLFVDDERVDPAPNHPRTAVAWAQLCDRGRRHPQTDPPRPPPPPPPPTNPITPVSPTPGGPPTSGPSAAAAPSGPFMSNYGGYLVGGVACTLLVVFVIFGTVLIRRRSASLRLRGIESGSDWDSPIGGGGVTPSTYLVLNGDDTDALHRHGTSASATAVDINASFGTSHRSKHPPQHTAQERLLPLQGKGPHRGGTMSDYDAAATVPLPPLQLHAGGNNSVALPDAQAGALTTTLPRSPLPLTAGNVAAVAAVAASAPRSLGKASDQSAALATSVVQQPGHGGARGGFGLLASSGSPDPAAPLMAYATGATLATTAFVPRAATVSSSRVASSGVVASGLGAVYFPPCYTTTQTEISSTREGTVVSLDSHDTAPRPRLVARAAKATARQRQLKAKLESNMAAQEATAIVGGALPGGGPNRNAPSSSHLGLLPQPQQQRNHLSAPEGGGASACTGLAVPQPAGQREVAATGHRSVVSDASSSTWDMRSSQYTTAEESSVAGDSLTDGSRSPHDESSLA